MTMGLATKTGEGEGVGGSDDDVSFSMKHLSRFCEWIRVLWIHLLALVFCREIYT